MLFVLPELRTAVRFERVFDADAVPDHAEECNQAGCCCYPCTTGCDGYQTDNAEEDRQQNAQSHHSQSADEVGNVTEERRDVFHFDNDEDWES